MNRRDFLKSLGFTTLTALMPQLALANSIGFHDQRRLVVLIELKGANDGLNTLVPFTDQTYYDSRPNIALDSSGLYKLSGKHGLHAGLKPLASAWETNEMAWVQGLGYENSSRSHFESIEIWESAQLDGREFQNGWVSECFPEHELGGIAVDTNLGPLYGDKFSALSISDPYRFVNQGQRIKSIHSKGVDNSSLQHILNIQSEVDMMADTLAGYLDDIPKTRQAFAHSAFGRSLNSIYTLIASGINVPAYKVSLGNFDTHVAQSGKHATLMNSLAEGISALRTNLKHLGMWDEVAIMTYSEFGRRVAENGSKGTDHGTAAPHMIVGGKVRGGFYGEQPSLTDLDDRGDMFHTTDFRDMYATIREDWWELKSDGQSQSLGFL